MTSEINSDRGNWIDRLTQQWVKASRNKINLKQEGWLNGPIGNPDIIGENYFEEFVIKNDFVIDSNQGTNGLVEDFSHLNSSSFDVNNVNPRIIEFYEKTSSFELDIWSEWATMAKPFGWLLAKIFSQRLQQLNLPVSPLDSSRGITSQILSIRHKESSAIQYVGWLRKIIKTGNVIYAGAYTSCIPPNLNYECVKVVFPLPNGNATVILWPENMEDGSLKLHSSGNKFGDAGFYLLVLSDKERAFVKYVKSLKETLHVYTDENGILRTDHIFKYFGVSFLQLHYRMTKKKYSAA